MKAIFFNAKRILYDRPNPHYYLRAFLESQGLPLPSDDEIKTMIPDVKNLTKRGRLVHEVYSDALLKACGLTDPALFVAGERAIERDRTNITMLPFLRQAWQPPSPFSSAFTSAKCSARGAVAWPR
ncbi:MAG: hypothetical protein JW726_17995 [Anaerolineales bacterium]|nr:hypothetical protein [Anaerolineales bacterium]